MWDARIWIRTRLFVAFIYKGVKVVNMSCIEVAGDM